MKGQLKIKTKTKRYVACFHPPEPDQPNIHLITTIYTLVVITKHKNKPHKWVLFGSVLYAYKKE